MNNWGRENWRTIVVIVVVAVLTYFTAGAASAWGAGLYASATGTVGAAAGSVAATAAGAFGGAVAGGYIGAVAGGLGAALNGGNLGDVLRGALIGGVQGAITGGVLHGLGEAASAAGTFSAETALHVAGHGVVGGAANVAMGGKFGDGFLSGAVSAAAGDAGLFGPEGGGFGGMARRTIMAGVVGGTASALGGGKFANGAYTAAFQHLLNAELPDFIPDVTKMKFTNSAFQTGWRWLRGPTGSEGNSLLFDQNSEMGQDLMRFPEVKQAMRSSVVNSSSEIPWFRSAGGEALGSYVKTFFADLFGVNPTRALHGSISGTARYDGNSTIRIRATDTLSFVSVTHLPLSVSSGSGLNWSGLYPGTTYGANSFKYLPNNSFGLFGVGSNLRINYNLTIKFR